MGVANELLTSVSASDVIAPVLTGLIGFGIGEYRRRRQKIEEQHDEKIAWFEKSQRILYGGIHSSQQIRLRSEIDYSRLSERFQNIAEELRLHSQEGQGDVPIEYVDGLKNASVIYAKIGGAAEVADEKSTNEALEELFEIAQNESRNPNRPTLNTIFHEAADHSTSFDKLRKADNQASGFDIDEILEVVEEMFDDADPEEFVAVMSELSPNDDSLIVDQNLYSMMFGVMELAEEVSIDVYDHLESGKKNVEERGR